MKIFNLLLFTLTFFVISIHAQSQTAHTIITLDGSSPDQYFNTLYDSVPSLGHLLSGVEAQFGSIEASTDKLNKVEDKLTTLEQSNIITRIARLNRKYYAALIEIGFTPEDAMKLIIANPIVELLKMETPQKTRSITSEVQ